MEIRHRWLFLRFAVLDFEYESRRAFYFRGDLNIVSPFPYMDFRTDHMGLKKQTKNAANDHLIIVFRL